MITDPIELRVADALREAGIEFVHESSRRARTTLDFYLPGHGVYIECKQFHTDRLAGQMAQAENVIAVQGRGAALLLCKLLRKGLAP